jgi:hypothetical protein
MAFLSYFIGVSALGVVVGYLVALSASPVVGVLLPLMFGLLGGAGAIYTAKLDFRDPSEREKLNTAGISLACFALAIVVSSAVALHYRNYVPPLPLGLSKAQAAEQVDHAVQLAKLRRQLQLLGVTDAETSSILAAAPTVSTVAADNSSAMMEKARNIARAFGTLNKRLTVAPDADASLKDIATGLKAMLAYLELSLPETADQFKSNEAVATRVLNLQLAYAKQTARQVTGGNDTALWSTANFEKISQNGAVLSAILETRAVLEAYEVRFSEEIKSPSFFKDTALVAQNEKVSSPLKSVPTLGFAYQTMPLDTVFDRYPRGFAN